jgi:hypothetical protein
VADEGVKEGQAKFAPGLLPLGVVGSGCFESLLDLIDFPGPGDDAVGDGNVGVGNVGVGGGGGERVTKKSRKGKMLLSDLDLLHYFEKKLGSGQRQPWRRHQRRRQRRTRGW